MLTKPFSSTMQADATVATNLLTFGHVSLKSADQPKCIFEFSGGSNAPTLVPNTIPSPQNGSLSLVAE